MNKETQQKELKSSKMSKFSDKNWFSIGTNKMKNKSVSKIQNVSQQAVIDGDCFDPTTSNLHLIQITDYESEFVEPKNWNQRTGGITKA